VATLQAGQQAKGAVKAQAGAGGQPRHLGGEGHVQVAAPAGAGQQLRHKIGSVAAGGEDREWETGQEEEEDVGADYDSQERGWDRPWLKVARGHVLVVLNVLFVAVVLAVVLVRTRRRRRLCVGQRDD
jgi:hypothetical protein